MTSRREEPQTGKLAEQFAEICRQRKQPPDVFAFLEAANVADPPAQADVLLVDQALRIQQGRMRPVEEYFANFPLVAGSEALRLELAAGEYQERVRNGDDITVETFLARFPQMRDQLSQRLPATADHLSESTLDVPMDSLINPAESTVDVPMEFITNLSAETTVDVPMESLMRDQPQQTIDVPADSLPSLDSPDEKSSPRNPIATVEWETNQGFVLPSHSQEDTHQNEDQSNETLDIDPKSLTDMMKEFHTAEVSQSAPTHAFAPPESPNSPTLFAEGVAYDKSHPRTQFGEYALLGEIARGGMGVVFKARQEKLKRVVALKMILAGQLAGKEDIRRFYVEAEAAAALDHPGIVPIYEVGEYRGQHFFSMGYVEGESLADKISEHPLPAREAASMLKTIAEAVEYAHQQGVIHRDLKPANVLLDAHGQPKITDFGLAKRTEAKAELTATGQIMGTPSYMPPEQATGDSSQVGPHSDIYSLGAVLYCLLTGRPPFQAPTVLELLQQVKLQEPVSPKRLMPNLPVDLETICLKCLAKEPEQRYETAQKLAEDLDRFLRGIPVLARPVGTAERVWRWCKRYPAVAGLMAAVVVSLILGAAVSTSYAVIANRRAEETLEQYQRAEENYVRAEQNFERAERNFQKAQAAVDQFFVQVSENTLLNQPGMQPLQHELLNQALEYYQAFLEERSDDLELQDELAITHFRVGLITEAVDSPKAAIPAFEKARAAQQSLLDEMPKDPTRLKALGNTLTAWGRVVYRTQNASKAEPIYRQAVEVRETLASVAKEDLEAQRELANGYMNLGLVEKGHGETATDPAQKTAAMEAALGYYGMAQNLRENLVNQAELPRKILRKVHQDLGRGAYNLGILQLQMKQAEQGRQELTHATQHFASALKIDPDDQRNTLQLAICYRLLSLGLADQQKAWEYCKQAAVELEPLVRANPRIAEYRKELINLRLSMAEVARRLNRPQEIKSAIQNGREMIEELLAEQPHDPKLLLQALVIYRTLAELAEPGQPDGMDNLPLNAIAQIQDRVRQQQNADERHRREFAMELLQLGHHVHRHGHVELALKLSRDGVSIAGKLVQEFGHNLDHRYNHTFGLTQLGELLADHQQHISARETYLKLLAALGELEKRIPDKPESAFDRAQLQFELAKANNALAGISGRQQNWVQAVQELNAARNGLKALILQFPNDRAVFQKELNHTEQMLGWLETRPAHAEKPSPAARVPMASPPHGVP